MDEGPQEYLWAFVHMGPMHINGNILDLGGAFLGGVLVSLTPCVYPLIPVTTAAIAGANASGSRRAAFFLSLVYVSGMAVVYAGLALVAAMSGKVFGVLQNTPLALGVIAAVFFFFALAMIDVVPLPTFRIFSGAKPKGPLAVFVMGAASGFVVGPCTAPALGALLVYVASKQNLLYGAGLLLVFAYGVGTTLILAGTLGGFTTKHLRSGPWMVWVKNAAGLVLFVFAGYYCARAFNIVQ